MSVFLATRYLGLRLDIDKGLQDLLKFTGIFLVARLIARGEDDISDSLRKLDIADAFPLGVSFCRWILVDEVVVAVLSLAGSNFLFWDAMLCLHFVDRCFNECVYTLIRRAGHVRVHHRLRIRPRR